MSPRIPLLRLTALALLGLLALWLSAALSQADHGGPTVTAVAVSSAPAGDAYALGETIRVSVTFSEAVTVTGTPRLSIDMDPADWGTKQAAYESGSGTASLVFAHTVVEPNYSAQGIAVLANSLELNGGTIRSARGADAHLDHSGLGHDAAQRVNWQLAPPSAPSVVGLAVTSAPAGDAYTAGETIRVSVGFSEAVTVTGTPRLSIDMDPADWGTKRAAYESGSGTAALVFAYDVVAPNYSTQGIAVLANTLELNGGAIRSATGVDARLGHAGLDHDSAQQVNWQLAPPDEEEDGVDGQSDPPTAQQNAATTFVSNTGQSLTSQTNVGWINNLNWRQVTSFTTGGNTGGYTLSEVDLRLGASSSGQDASTIKVSIYSTNSAGAPDSSLYVLTNPSTITDDAVNTFTAPSNAALDASTTYAVFVETTSTDKSFAVRTSASDDEDSGASSGWSIADGLRRATDLTTWSGERTEVFGIAIKGTLGSSTSTALIGNLDQTHETAVSLTSRDLAQAFTTGSSAATLTSVDVKFDSSPGSTVRVQVRTGSATGTVLATLTNPSTRVQGINTFTAPSGTTLAASTTYVVVVDSTASGSVEVTNSDAEDSGGATGWSIANTAFRRSPKTTGTWSSHADAMKIRVNGTITAANSAPTVANEIPDQTATAGTAFSFTFDANAFNDADSGDTLTYTAAKSDDGALPSWLSFDASTRTFSGTPAAGDVGTVSVKVTATDGTASVSDTFDIVVSVGQAVVKLVGNTGHANTSPGSLNSDHAQSFTTGGNSGGYMLTKVAIELRRIGAAPTYSVSIHDASGSNPGSTVVATLNKPASLPTTTRNAEFTVGGGRGVALAANTTYFVVWDVSVESAQGGQIWTVNSNAEDSGKASGWSIGDNGRFRDSGDTSWTNSNNSRQIEVHGCSRPASNSAPTVDNGISDQTASPGTMFSFQFAANAFADTDTCSPGLTYTATKSDSTALPGWLTFTAATRTFSGTPAASDIGTIAVKVTASDGTASVSDTFDIVVANAAPTVANPIPDQPAWAGTAFRFQFDENAFNDTNVGDTLTYTAALEDGSMLPSWLSFAASTRTFSGTPAAADIGTISVKVTASDGTASVSDTFDIVVGKAIVKLVGNSGQTAGDSAYEVGWFSGMRFERGAQSFTTGSADSTLAEVRIRLSAGGVRSASPKVSIYSTNASGEPVASLYELKNPASYTDNAINTFTAPLHATLSATTTYAVVIETTATAQSIQNRIVTNATTSDSEDSGGQSGWSVANDRHSQLTNQAWSTNTAVIRIDVHGTVVTPPDAPSAPTVTANAGARRLSVSWSAPTNTGDGAITDYDLRYFAGSADPTDEADWIEEGEDGGPPNPGTSTSALILGLSPETAYRVQVRAEGAGESAWSASGTATTPANTAPRVLQKVTWTGTTKCAVNTDPENTAIGSVTATPNTLVSVGVSESLRSASDTGAWPQACREQNSPHQPYFDDVDGDTLTFTVTSQPLPDNVRVTVDAQGDPIYPTHVTGRAYWRGIGVLASTPLQVDVTATDPSGATATGHVIFNVAAGAGDVKGAPSFGDTVADQTWTQGRAITALQLPAASGGDLAAFDHDFNGATDPIVPFGYFYEVTGLPAGLTFDPETRRITGAPTAAGSFTVSYTADDEDDVQTVADAASLSFTVTVNENPNLPEFVMGWAVDTTPVQVTLFFDRELSGSHVPAGSAFRIEFAGNSVALSNLQVSGQTVTMNLVAGLSLQQGTALTASYTPPSSNPLQTASGDQAVSFSAQSLINRHTGNAPGTPTLSSATVNGASLVLTYNQTLNPLAVPDGSLFTVKGAGADQNPTAVTIDGATLTLTLGHAAANDDTITVSYDNTPQQSRTQNLWGERVASLTDQAVTNNTTDSTAPVLQSAVVDGSALTLTYDEGLDSGSVPASSAFTVKVGGTAVSLASTNPVVLSGKTVTLNLASAVTSSDTVTVSYAAPSTNPLQDVTGNDAASFTDQAVTHAVVPTALTLRDTTLTLTYPEALNESSVPAASAFTVKVGGTAVNLAGTDPVGVAGDTVTLTLASAPTTSGAATTVSYAVPESAPLQKSDNTAVHAFTDKSVNWAPEYVGTATRHHENAHPGVLASLTVVEGDFSDPDGGALTFEVAWSRTDVFVAADTRWVGGLLFFKAKLSCEMALLDPVPDKPLTTTATITATDPSGASVQQTYTFRTDWDVLPSSATVNGSSLVLTYCLDLDTTRTAPATSAYAVNIAGSAVTVSSVTLAQNTVTLALGTAAVAGQAVTLSYTAPSSNQLQTERGIDADNINNRTVTNNTPAEMVPPVLQSAAVNGAALTLTYNEALNGASTPASSAFTPKVNGTTVSLASTSPVAVSGMAVTLTLAAAVGEDDTVTVSYSVPSSNPIEDAAGNDAPAFTDRSVTNNTPDTTPPVLQSATVNRAAITLTYDDELDEASVPPASVFTVTVNGAAVELASSDPVSISGMAVTIELAAAVSSGSTVLLTYVATGQPDDKHIRNDARLQAGYITERQLTNQTPAPAPPSGGGGGGAPVGGGGGGVGAPADEPGDFERNTESEITADEIERLAASGGVGTVSGSGGAVLVVQDSDEGPRLVLYTRVDGELQATLEIELDPQNASPRSQTSEGSTAWVLDDEAMTLFAYDLESGERKPEADIELDNRYGLPQSISAVGGLILTLHNPLVIYDRDTGALLGEFTLDRSNRDPRGVWSDGVTVWVSDHAAKRIFAYRLPDIPEPPEATDMSESPDSPDMPDASDELDAFAELEEPRQPVALERVRSEEFTLLRRAGNSSPRAIWSDGEVMFVADEQDDKIYAYNMPAAIDARLASLSLSEIDLGEFSNSRLSYEAEYDRELELVTVGASSTSEGATVVIAPDDADDDTENGHQVALEERTLIEITVTSEDESRTRLYTVALERSNAAPVALEIPVVELTAGDEPVVLNLDDYFSDPDGDELNYTVESSSDDEVATVEAAGPMLRITPVAAGIVSFLVSASDGELESEARLIVVTVDPAAPVTPPIEVRLTARPLASGAVEFGLQERNDGGSWQERLLPRLRFLQTDSEVGRWRVSSAIEVGEGDATRTLRIVARRIANGAVEFALVIRQEDGRWSAHLLPRARILPSDSATDRWRYSTPLLIVSP